MGQVAYRLKKRHWGYPSGAGCPGSAFYNPGRTAFSPGGRGPRQASLIATAVGGNPEIVSDRVNGFLVAQSDVSGLSEKIKFLAQNPDEAERMGENSRRIWQEKFSSERMFKHIDRLYCRLIAESGR